jgi:DNA-binding transcriptional regulator YiaG
MPSPLELSIREFRQAWDLSQEGLARAVGVSVRTIARWESGLSHPSSLAMYRLRQVILATGEEARANVNR